MNHHFISVDFEKGADDFFSSNINDLKLYFYVSICIDRLRRCYERRNWLTPPVYRPNYWNASKIIWYRDHIYKETGLKWRFVLLFTKSFKIFCVWPLLVVQIFVYKITQNDIIAMFKPYYCFCTFSIEITGGIIYKNASVRLKSSINKEWVFRGFTFSLKQR